MSEKDHDDALGRALEFPLSLALLGRRSRRFLLGAEIPVGDLAQHVLLMLCYLLQNGNVITDDINRRSIPGIERYGSLVDVGNVYPLTLMEQNCQAEIAVELSTGCYAGTLMLQAMGLGGWMFDGLDPFSVLGASGDPQATGLGFRYDPPGDTGPIPTRRVCRASWRDSARRTSPI